MPFITEEIWQKVAPIAGVDGDSIMLQPYPEADQSKLNPQANDDVQWLKAVIVAIRTVRGEMNIPPGKQIPVLLSNCSAEDQRRIDQNRQFLTTLAKLDSLTVLAADVDKPMSVTQLIGDMELLVPMADLIDKDAELARLDKEIGKLEKEVQRLSLIHI